jgi:hypothetical protein
LPRLPNTPTISANWLGGRRFGVSAGDGAGRARKLALNEDWAATIAGLVLLVLVLTGIIPAWLVP